MKDEIISRLDIHEYINRFVPLHQKAPGQYLGLCPFHNEKTPSFSVSTEKKFFHCFGCKASGDVIKFTMMIDNIPFAEAIKKLAQEIGITVRSIKNERFERNKQYIEVNSVFTKICNDLLYDKNASQGLEYIKKRGIKDELIHKYSLGYFPSHKSDEILKTLTDDFSEDIILKSGVFKVGNNQKLYSPFFGRIIFPIFDSSKRNVGFGSRIITNDKDKAKYLNSSDSDFFHKSELLYGIEHMLGDQQLKATKTIFVVEGYMDVISLANNGITNAVGVLGANLAETQLKQLWRLTEKPTVCFDGDNAGRNAMARVAKIALPIIEPGKTVSFLEILLCKDPDEFITKYGSDEFLKMSEGQKVSLADYLYKIQASDLSLDDPDDVVVLRQRLTNICNEISNDALRNAYKSHFNKVFYTKKSPAYKNDGKKNYPQNKLYSSEITFLSGTTAQKKYTDIEEEICDIIAAQKILLLDQSILDEFMKCKFFSKKADNMRFELTKEIHPDHVPVDLNIDEKKKSLQKLFIFLEIRNVQDEISNLEDTNEIQLLKLKQYEMELKNKLSSTLI
jgi:DNA primase